MDNIEAPEATVSDNALTSGFTPEQSAAPVEQGQAEQSATEWHSGYSDDFKSLIEKKGLSGLSQQEAFENIGKSYSNLESLKNVSGENLFNLSADMDDEMRSKAYDALGRPAQADQYSYKPADTDNKDLVDAFLNSSHELGLTDKQVSTLIPTLNEKIMEIANGQTAELQSKNNNELSELKTEWGGSYETKVNLAMRAAEAIGIDEDLQVAVRDSGQSAKFLRALEKVGLSISEGGMAGMSPQSGSAAMGVMSPQDAQMEIDKKMADPEFKARYLSQTQSVRVAAAKELEPFRKAAVK